MAWEIEVHTYNCGDIKVCECKTQEATTAMVNNIFNNGFQIGTFENSAISYYPATEVKLIEARKKE